MSNDADRPVKTNRGSGDLVQRAAREKRIKQNLRENLKRRKEKARAVQRGTQAENNS